MTTSSRAGYIREIDAMRACAVMAVVLYHGFPSLFPGGFVGVDVFFVISGFVITRGYLARLESGETTFLEFYKKRVRRLLPASALMLFVTAAMAVTIVPPEKLIAFGWSLAAQAVFLQNFVFWAEGDYFSGPLTKPLLHTWSLAVEEQFYLLWPLLILLFRRTRRWTIVVLALCFVSIAACYLLEVRSPKTVFYLLPFRVWQFGAGMLAHFACQRFEGSLLGLSKTVALGQFLGLAAVSTIMGGEWAIFPSLGNAALVLSTAIALFVVGSSTASTPSVIVSGPIPYVGRISYSFYLWHWPPLALLFLATGAEATALQASLCMLAAFAAAAASFHYLEEPIRRGTWISPSALMPSWVMTSTMTSAVGLALIWSQGLLVRYPPEIRPFLIAAMEADRSRCSYFAAIMKPDAETCVLNDAGSGRPTVLLVGDSHVAVVKSVLANVARERNVNLLLAVRNCDLGRYGQTPFCSISVRDELIAEAKTLSVDTIVAMSYWDYGEFDEDSLARDLRAFSRATSNITIVETVPYAADYDPKIRIERYEAGEDLDRSGISRQEFDAEFASLAAVITGGVEASGVPVRILSPSEHLCPEDQCLYFSAGKVLYLDANHLTLAGAQLLRPMFADEIFRFEQAATKKD